MWDLSSLTRDWTCTPWIGRWSLNHWTIREILICVYLIAAAAAAKSYQSCPTLCNPLDGSPPGSPVPGILQARILEWVAISFSNVWKWNVKWSCSACLTLRNPMDCSLPGSSIHGIFPGKSTRVGPNTFYILISHEDFSFYELFLQVKLL